jgi:hypothetical protein
VRILILVPLLVLCGCLDLRVQGGSVPDLKPPSEAGLSFKSKGALASGATLQNVTANQVYYEGCKPKSSAAKILVDMSYRFLGLVGVNMRFDPSDPDSIKKVFADADNAITEKDKIIHDLREQSKEYLKDLAGAHGERDSVVTESKTFRQRVWGVIWSIAGVLLLVVLVLGGVQAFTGIPLLTGMLPWAIRRMHDTSKQTVVAVQKIREELKASDVPEEKALLSKMDRTLNDTQDDNVRAYVRQLKEM